MATPSTCWVVLPSSPSSQDSAYCYTCPTPFVAWGAISPFGLQRKLIEPGSSAPPPLITYLIHSLRECIMTSLREAVVTTMHSQALTPRTSPGAFCKGQRINEAHILFQQSRQLIHTHTHKGQCINEAPILFQQSIQLIHTHTYTSSTPTHLTECPL